MKTLRACDSVSAVRSIYSFSSDSSLLSGILSGLLPGANGTGALLSPVWSGWLVLIHSRSFVRCGSVLFSNRVRDLFYARQHGSEWTLALWFVQWIFKSLFGRISVNGGSRNATQFPIKDAPEYLGDLGIVPLAWPALMR